MSKISHNQGVRKERSLVFIFVVLVSIVGITALLNRFVNPGLTSVSITNWYDDHKAAYSIIHDDLCLSDCYGIIEFADTIAFNRGIKVAMGASVGACSDGGDTLWPKLQQIVSHGHELISHGKNHGASVDLGWTPENWDYDTDMVQTKATLEKEVPGAEISFFIFPYDAYNDQRIEELKKAGYLGVRAGRAMYQDRGVNRFSGDYDPYRTVFDAYMSKPEQDLIDSSDNPYTTSIYNDDSICVAQQHINAAIMSFGWSLQELHSVDTLRPRSWGQIEVDDYRALLDYAVVKRSNKELWVETPTTVAKYAVTRNALKGITTNGSKLIFKGQPTDERYNSPVTLRLETRNNPETLSIWQDGKEIVAEKRGDNLFIATVSSYDEMVVSFSNDK